MSAIAHMEAYEIGGGMSLWNLVCFLILVVGVWFFFGSQIKERWAQWAANYNQNRFYPVSGQSGTISGVTQIIGEPLKPLRGAQHLHSELLAYGWPMEEADKVVQDNWVRIRTAVEGTK